MYSRRRTTRALVAVLTLVGGAAVAYSPASVGDSATPAPASGSYAGDGRVGKDAPWHVDGLDFFFEGVPASNHPGVKPVTFHNRSDHEEHEIIFFKLADANTTIDQAVVAANTYGEHGLVSSGFATAELGELKIGPDSTLVGEFDFAEPGAYVYYCFIETHGGHWNYGMVGKMLISQPAAPA